MRQLSSCCFIFKLMNTMNIQTISRKQLHNISLDFWFHRASKYFKTSACLKKTQVNGGMMVNIFSKSTKSSSSSKIYKICIHKNHDIYTSLPQFDHESNSGSARLDSIRIKSTQNLTRKTKNFFLAQIQFNSSWWATQSGSIARIKWTKKKKSFTTVFKRQFQKKKSTFGFN